MNTVLKISALGLFLAISVLAVDELELSVTGTNVRLDWEAVPSRSYDVYSSPSLVNPSWSNVAPGGIVFSNVLGLCNAPLGGPAHFYHVAEPDLYAPTVEALIPISNAVAVATNAVVYISFEDQTGIATNTLVITIAGWTNMTSASPYLSWSNSTVIFMPPSALGEPGAMITNCLTISDTLGHTLSNYTWNFEIARPPVATSEFLSLTAPAGSKRTASGRLRTLPNVKPKAEAPVLEIQSVTSNMVVFSYETTPPVVTSGTKLVSFDAAYPFYRSVISNTVDTGLQHITAWTEDIPLTDILEAGSCASVNFTPADPGATKKELEDELNLLHVEFGDDLSGTELLNNANLKLWLPECTWSWVADVDVAGVIEWGRLKSFDTTAQSELTIHINPEAIFHAAVSGDDEFPLVAPVSKIFGAMLGPMPVWIEIMVELNAGYEYDTSISGNAHTVVDVSKELVFSVQLREDQWTYGVDNTPIVFEADPITWQLEGDANVKIYIRPKLTILAFSLAGLWADVLPYTELDGTYQNDPLAYEWALYFGLSSTLGIESLIWYDGWGDTPEWQLFDERWPLWSTVYPASSASPVFAAPFPNKTVKLGGSLTLSGWASAIPDAEYKWYYNGSRIVGATQPEYTIRQANAGYAGTYAVQAYNEAGIAQTSCTVNVYDSYILSQPLVNAAANVNRTQGFVTWQSRTEEGIWADAEITYCARFTRMCFGEFTGRFATAIDMYEHFSDLNLVRAEAEPPAAAVVFYGRHAENANCGHVGIADGHGKLYSVVNRTSGVLLTSVTGTFQAAYLGYVTAQDFKTYHLASSSTGTYMVVDLSGGPSASNYPVSYLNSVPSGGWSDEYKTTKMVLRKIPKGSFTMGSPTNELGCYSYETQHFVTLTKDFYIGVFEVTQKQWERVRGTWPSYCTNVAYRDSRPVEKVSYRDVRENNNFGMWPQWPASSQVGVDSFMGKMRSRTGLSTFDLPTESQWEYACRAGTTEALNSGYNLTNTSADTHMDSVGRYSYNHPGGFSADSSVGTEGGSAKVGSYQPNAWGLYDMHGNVYEWCLDWWGAYPGAGSDPLGAEVGMERVLRGGSWLGAAWLCRSALRHDTSPSGRVYYYGFRVASTLP